MATDARALVVHGVAQLRAQRIGWRLATSRRVGGFAHVYDTLVLTLSPEIQRAVDAPHASGPVGLVREVLTTWHAVSRRAGLSFRDNLDFWMDALGQKASNDVFIVPMAHCAFPRVVFHWEARPCASSRDDVEQMLIDLQHHVLDIFVPSPTARETAAVAIECTVRVHLRKTAKATKSLFSYLTSQVQTYGAQQALRQPRFVWTGVEIAARHGSGRDQGLTASQMKIIEAFCQAMPPSFHVTMPLTCSPYGWIESQGTIPCRVFAPFVQHMCGFLPSNVLGHLRVLDLTSAFRSSWNPRDFQPELTSVCTLLPFTTSLCELRLEITSRHEFLWLAYALFHPRLPETKLRSVALNFAKYFQHEIDLHDWRRLLFSRSRMKTLQDMLTQTERGFYEASSSSITGDALRSATIVKRTNLRDSTGAVLVALKTGDKVELCDGDQIDDEADAIAVVVPGYGLGWVARSHVSSSVETVYYSSPPQSCLTGVLVDDMDVSPSDQVFLLQLFGNSLTSFRTPQPKWFQWKEQPTASFRELTPRLQTVDCVAFSPALAGSDFRLLPHLHSLGLRCTDDDVGTCLAWLSRRDSFRALRCLRLHVSLDLATCSNEFIRTLTKIIEGRRSLRELTFILAHKRVLPTHQFVNRPVVPADPDVARRKRALLSVVSHLQSTASSTHALAHFDAHLLGLVFDFWGFSIQFIRICVVPAPQLGAIVPRDEMLTLSDALWYDAFS